MSKNKQIFDIVILGGGAAGLMCALTAGRRGKKVLVVEVSNKLGKKILMSGGGRCNFTNLDVTADNFICNNPHFVKSALHQFTQWDFISMVSEYGIAYHEKDQGQLFCDNSAKDILNMLVKQCRSAGVKFLLNCEVNTVTQNALFELQSNRDDFVAHNLVVATGGLSIPTLGGATGFGYRLAKQFGLSLNPRQASLVPFTLTGKWHDFSRALSGVSIGVEVCVNAISFADNLLFTHRGISGPAILQLSNYWHTGETISINLLPAIDLAKELINAKRSQPNAWISTLLAEHLPKSLVQALYRELWYKEHEAEPNLQSFKDSDLQSIAGQVNNWQLLPSGTEGYRTAEVTRGGVDVSLISSKTMRHVDVQGLYFIGEVLDVTGHLGGYNFQWAWSSGFVAGMACE